MAVHTEWHAPGLKSREWNTDMVTFTRWNLLQQVIEARALTQAEIDMFSPAEDSLEQRVGVLEAHTHDLSGLATAGHAHPSAETVAVVSADQSVTTTAQTAITGLSVPVPSAGSYLVTALLSVTAAAATTGPRPALTAGGSPATLAYRTETAATATTAVLSFTTAGAATTGVTSQTPLSVTGLVRYATAPAGGTAIGLTIASEIAGSAVVVKAGSVLIVRKVA